MARTDPTKRVTLASPDTVLNMLEALPSALFFLDDSGIILYANASAQALIEATPEEIIGEPLVQTLWWSPSPGNHEKLGAAMARASQGETVPFQARIQPREGRDRDLEATITRHVDADHRSYLIFSGIAITAHKCADIHALIDAIPQFVWTARADGSTEYSNQRWRDYTGLSVEEWLQCLHPDDRRHSLDAWRTAVQTGMPYEMEHRVQQGSTGVYRWFLTRAMPVRDDTGQIVKWFGTSTDINDQKRIEQALRQSQERIRALIDSNLIGIVTSEGEEEVAVEANEAFLQMSGYCREDLDQRRLTWARITLPKEAPLFEHAHQELVTCGQHTPFETELVCNDGSHLPILVGGVLFQDYSRQVVSFVLNNAARKELDRRKDDFISLASHELRTPLTALKLQTSRLYRQLAKQGFPDSLPALARIDSQVNRLTRLVGELLDLSKIQAGRLEYAQEPVDLDQLLQETVEDHAADLCHPHHPPARSHACRAGWRSRSAGRGVYQSAR
jgi:PAS domain S-box-containing protein